MAAGVLATLPVTRGVVGTEELPVLVFACVLTTILVFAVGFPLAKARLASEAPLLGEASVLEAPGDAEPVPTPPPASSEPAPPLPADAGGEVARSSQRPPPDGS
jgi:hypothetical protein